MKKVLHIGEYVQGGVATYLKTLVTDDVEQGIENHLLISKEKSEQQWNLPATRIHYYDYKRGLSGVLFAMSVIRKEILNIEPDIIYCHSSWAGVLTRFPYLFKKKSKYIIYNAHGWSFLMDTATWKKKIYALIELLLAKVTDKIVNVSQYEYNGAIRYGIPSNKMCVIYSGISMKKGEDNAVIQMDKNKVNLLFVGRFDPQKGIDILLRSFNKCDRKDIHLYIIGDNIVSNSKNIKKENTDRMTFLGWIDHNHIAAYYESCDAVIMPSRWEAFGLVAIEAMKYGKPVIVSNRGALPELIVNGKNGYVINIDDDDLKNIIDRLSKDECKEKKKIIQCVFKEKYTAENMILRTRKLYYETGNEGK